MNLNRISSTPNGQQDDYLNYEIDGTPCTVYRAHALNAWRWRMGNWPDFYEDVSGEYETPLEALQAALDHAAKSKMRGAA